MMKTIAAIIIFLCIVKCDAFCQIIETEWIRNYGGTNWDENYSSLINTNGNLVLACNTSSDDYDIDTTLGQGDILLMELSNAGDVLWSSNFGGSNLDVCYGIIQSIDHGYLICGGTYSTDGDIIDYYGNNDALVYKVDSIGNLIWTHNYGGSNWDEAYCISETESGNIVLACGSTSSDGLITGHHGGATTTDIWVMLLNAEGNVIWEKSYGSNLDDYPSDMYDIGDGRFIICGSSGQNSGDVSGNHGGSDIWVFEIDPLGNLNWQHCYGGSEGDGAGKIIKLNNSFLISGRTFSSNGDVVGFNGGSDAWLIEIDTIGVLITQKCYGGSGADFLPAVSYSNQLIYTCGFTNSESGAITNIYGNEDVWFLVLDTLLNIQGQYLFGGTETEYGNSLALDQSSNIYISGWTESTDIEFPEVYGGRDIFAIKLNICDKMFFADTDGDGYGNLLSDTLACSAPVGYVADSTDCNDADASQYPSAIDICNAFDDNCNGLIDEDVVFSVYYVDFDGDNYGDELVDSIACMIPTGYVNNNLDCNDTDILINPDAPEACNGIDDNCNALIDDGLIIYTLYADADGDSFGNPSVVVDTCIETLPGYVSNDLDCNDLLASIYPGATEVCNALDDDCNGIIDDNLTFTWLYQDADGDLFGNASVDTLVCMPITGFVSDSTDCDDSNLAIYPGAMELLNGVDDDCDKLIDEGLGLNFYSNGISIYPNPTTGFLSIELNDLKTGDFELYSSSGSLMEIGDISSKITIIDLQSVPAGIYHLIYKTDTEYSVFRIVKVIE